MGAPLGIYIHLPFCQSKCAYCDFPSFAGQEARQEEYARAVCGEIRRRVSETGPLTADTVYLGGGTPSVMRPELVDSILTTLRDCVNILPEAEISCEANPGTLKPDFLAMLRANGVNRLSLGAQSAREEELSTLGRVHTWAEVAASVNLAREAGFLNLNLDLMSGLPNQTWERLSDSLKKALALSPTHLSCYSLIIEEGTPFHALYRAGRLALPSEDSEREMYHQTIVLLREAGYAQYEISNFAKPGMECRHNLNCWRYHDYLGFGAAAASLYRGERAKNPEGLNDYLSGKPPEVERLSPPDQRFEQVMLALRTREGLDLAGFEKRQGISLERAWPGVTARQIELGLMEYAGGFLRLTKKGFDLMDRALLEYLPG